MPFPTTVNTERKCDKGVTEDKELMSRNSEAQKGKRREFQSEFTQMKASIVAIEDNNYS